MSSKVKFQLNTDGVFQLMKSPEMMAVCEKYANDALATLGDGYEVTTHTGIHRVNASIGAISTKAKLENNKTNSILKALRG